MARPRKRLTATLPAEQALAVVEQLSDPFHAVWTRQGYRIADPCRFWRRKDGSWTGRFIYRHPGDPGAGTVTVVVRGIRFS